MILPISPDTPLLVRDGAATILFLHIGGGFLGIASGAAAMAFRKGRSLHRAAGLVFVVAMLTMSGIGAAVAPFLPRQQIPNTFAGVFTFYLVATGWAAVRRRPGKIGRFEVGAFLVALGAAVAGGAWVWWTGRDPHAAGGAGESVVSVFVAVAALAAVCDLRVILRGGVSGAPRLARHLWRMGVALLIAAGSFAGQPKAIPEALRGSPLLFLPMIAVAVSTIYWLVRVRIAKRISPVRAGRRPPRGPFGGPMIDRRPTEGHA